MEETDCEIPESLWETKDKDKEFYRRIQTKDISGQGRLDLIRKEARTTYWKIIAGVAEPDGRSWRSLPSYLIDDAQDYMFNNSEHQSLLEPNRWIIKKTLQIYTNNRVETIKKQRANPIEQNERSHVKSTGDQSTEKVEAFSTGIIEGSHLGSASGSASGYPTEGGLLRSKRFDPIRDL